MNIHMDELHGVGIHDSWGNPIHNGLDLTWIHANAISKKICTQKIPFQFDGICIS